MMAICVPSCTFLILFCQLFIKFFFDSRLVKISIFYTCFVRRTWQSSTVLKHFWLGSVRCIAAFLQSLWVKEVSTLLCPYSRYSSPYISFVVPFCFCFTAICSSCASLWSCSSKLFSFVRDCSGNDWTAFCAIDIDPTFSRSHLFHPFG